MAVESAAFVRYRRSPNEKTNLLRLFLGVLIIVAMWLASTVAVMAVGAYVQAAFNPIFGAGSAFDQRDIAGFLSTPAGFVTTMLSFAGIWFGTWIAMRFLHGERLGRLMGNSGRISMPGFAKGFAAVLLTSILAELVTYLMNPDIERGALGPSAWLLFLVPVLLLGFVQTSAEEVLFRGYLLRGLAFRFRSPLVWAALPTLAFTSLHWNPGAPLALNVAVFVSIGAFAAMLVALVWATGNLGAAMGAHLANNATGFLLVSHDGSLASFALFRGAPIGELATTVSDAITVVAFSVVAVLVALLLLLHRRSWLRVRPDLG